jgi:hypothetical protein
VRGFVFVNRKLLLISSSFFFICEEAFASESTGHSDPIAPALLAIFVVLLAAKLGGELFERLSLPAVLGELIAGIVLGNLVLINPGWTFLEPLRATPFQENWALIVDSLARLGVIVLLFEVGLESTVGGMMKVGESALLVAVLGVIAPFILGYAASWIFIKELPPALARTLPRFSLSYVHLFMGAVLCATSVGITARVFKDMGKLQTKEAQVILGAAVIDDVLGLVILVVVSGIVSAAELGRTLDIGSVLRLIGVAVLFLGGSLGIGGFLVPRIIGQLAKLRTGGMMVVSALLFCFGMAYLADFGRTRSDSRRFCRRPAAPRGPLPEISGGHSNRTPYSAYFRFSRAYLLRAHGYSGPPGNLCSALSSWSGGGAHYRRSCWKADLRPRCSGAGS